MKKNNGHVFYDFFYDHCYWQYINTKLQKLITEQFLLFFISTLAKLFVHLIYNFSINYCDCIKLLMQSIIPWCRTSSNSGDVCICFYVETLSFLQRRKLILVSTRDLACLSADVTRATKPSPKLAHNLCLIICDKCTGAPFWNPQTCSCHFLQADHTDADHSLLILITQKQSSGGVLWKRCS